MKTPTHQKLDQRAVMILRERSRVVSLQERVHVLCRLNERTNASTRWCSRVVAQRRGWGSAQSGGWWWFEGWAEPSLRASGRRRRLLLPPLLNSPDSCSRWWLTEGGGQERRVEGTLASCSAPSRSSVYSARKAERITVQGFWLRREMHPSKGRDAASSRTAPLVKVVHSAQTRRHRPMAVICIQAMQI